MAARKAREEERRLEEEEEARLAKEAADLIPKTFYDILEAKVPVLAFLSIAGAAPAFRCAIQIRSLLSALVSVHVTFSVSGVHEVPGSRYYDEIKRKSNKVKERMPQSSAAGPVAMYLRLKVKEMPVRRAILNRSLAKAVPLLRWEDCKRIKIVTHENIESLDRIIQRDVVSIGGADVPLLGQDRDFLRALTKITLTMTQFQNLQAVCQSMGEELIMPKITRLKVFVHHSGFTDMEFRDIYTAFPGLNRLHLVTLPAGLLPLCGPGIMAPPDLRLSLMEDSDPSDRHENFFVASHLMSLPFSWGANTGCHDFFRGVQRLQLSELNEDLQGLSLEKLLDSMKGGGMPQLKRLGTVSSKAASHFLKEKDECKMEECLLEELVVTTELEDVKDFFTSFLPLEQKKKRCSIRRLHVHIVCSDGAARVKMDVENAICAGWHNIAVHLMREDGWLVFSFGSKALQETAIGQLPWFMPGHFSLDSVNYGEVRLPVSTPLDRPLPFYGTDGVQQPTGTLVCGNLRRAAQEVTAELAESSMQTTSMSSLLSPSSPGNSSRPSQGAASGRSSMPPQKQERATSSSRRKSAFGQPVVEAPTRIYQSWQGMYMVDAIEALISAAEAQRAEFMNARPEF